ncbi:hypothetical protein T4B_12178 [Trichinella pseudospiralis]|uniref:Uncharacterized protein n=1 Tax=Trichinella pseudospiralis TaxID=6337 RepID=A0A0V1IK69_TRIPS|nr:hypothetical protein T4B_12178 [Trichinella pseudospiralis]
MINVTFAIQTSFQINNVGRADGYLGNMASGKLCKRVHRDLSQQATLGKHVMTMKGDCSAQRLIRLHKKGHHYM